MRFWRAPEGIWIAPSIALRAAIIDRRPALAALGLFFERSDGYARYPDEVVYQRLERDADGAGFVVAKVVHRAAVAGESDEELACLLAPELLALAWGTPARKVVAVEFADLVFYGGVDD